MSVAFILIEDERRIKCLQNRNPSQSAPLSHRSQGDNHDRARHKVKAFFFFFAFKQTMAQISGGTLKCRVGSESVSQSVSQSVCPPLSQSAPGAR